METDSGQMMLHKKDQGKIVDLEYCSLHYQGIKLTEIMHMRTFSRLVFLKIGITDRYCQRLERQKGRGVIERLGQPSSLECAVHRNFNGEGYRECFTVAVSKQDF
jgi:hypothetical protein